MIAARPGTCPPQTRAGIEQAVAVFLDTNPVVYFVEQLTNFPDVQVEILF